MRNCSSAQEGKVSIEEVSDDETDSVNRSHLKIDLENWMGELPEYLTHVPFIYLAIPGSHNTFSFSIRKDSAISPDSPQIIHSLGRWLKPISRRIIYNWSRGQRADIVEQLKAGVRYLDLRVVSYNNDIAVCHGLYGGRIKKFLEQINVFLDEHPKEVVILDIQHFYQFKDVDHEKLKSMVVNIFRNKVCHRQRRMRENTLHAFWQLNNQVLVVYRNKLSRNNDLLWPSGSWVTLWPNKIHVRELRDYVDRTLVNRNNGLGHVSQWILTPTTKYIALHLFGSLKNLAKGTNRKLISWLESKRNGVGGVNVIICDFVENYDFCEKVILLNYNRSNEPKKFIYELLDEVKYQKRVKHSNSKAC